MKVICSPGLGDHDLVSAEALLKPIVHKQKPRKVLLFAKEDWTTLKSQNEIIPTVILNKSFW